MKQSSISLDKLKLGKHNEDRVEIFLKNKGWNVKRNTFYDNSGNEVSQFIVINNYPKSYPDFTVEKYKDFINIKYLVEVKSMRRYFVNGSPAVTIPCYQFLSYKDIQDSEEIPVHIVFILHEDAFDKEEWYTETLNKLNKSKTYIENAYKDEDKHFVWKLINLKRME